jgi:hypothetical protein
MPREVTLEEIRSMAAENGLRRFTDEHFDELLTRTRGGRIARKLAKF